MTYYRLHRLIVARACGSVTLIPLNARLIISFLINHVPEWRGHYIQCTSGVPSMTASGRAGGAGPAPQTTDGTCHPGG